MCVCVALFKGEAGLLFFISSFDNFLDKKVQFSFVVLLM